MVRRYPTGAGSNLELIWIQLDDLTISDHIWPYLTFSFAIDHLMVVSTTFIFHFIYGIILPIDFHIFQDGFFNHQPANWRLQVHGVPHVHEHPTGRQGMSKNVRPFVCCFNMVYIYILIYIYILMYIYICLSYIHILYIIYYMLYDIYIYTYYTIYIDMLYNIWYYMYIY